jgi:hypothetical protein
MNLVEATNRSPHLQCIDAKTQSAILPQTKPEMTMRKKVLTVLVAPLICALTAQAAAASEHHHTPTKGRAVASEQFRNSNAYAAPGIAEQLYLQNEDEGAMTSGLAGH